MEELQTFSATIAQTIAALEWNPADTARQMALVGQEVVANNRQLANRIRRDPDDVGLEEALAAETRIMLAGAASLLLRAYGSACYDDACERGERIGVMLDEMARQVRDRDYESAQAMREEIASALADFAAIFRSTE